MFMMHVGLDLDSLGLLQVNKWSLASKKARCLKEIATHSCGRKQTY
jgi:hypothetical protein